MAEKPVKEVVEELLERVTKLENEDSGSAKLNGKSIEICLTAVSYGSSMTSGSTVEVTVNFSLTFKYIPRIFVQVQSSNNYSDALNMQVIVKEVDYDHCTLYIKNNNSAKSSSFNMDVLAIANNNSYTKIS